MREIRALTGLRGVAALIVVWFHMKDALSQRGVEFRMPLVIERLFFSGGHSVDVFFVLSGFILTLTYGHWFGTTIDGEHYWRFVQRRFARIYPLHFVLLLLTIVCVYAARALGAATVHGLERFDVATLPEYFLLVQAWGLFLNGIGEWNPPAWSISIEVLAYAVLPFVAWVVMRSARRHSWLPVIAAAAVGFTCNWITPWDTYGFAGISRGVSEFIFGAVTVNLLHGPTARWLQTTSGSVVALAGLLAACAVIEDTGFIVAFLTAPLLIALCADNVLARILGSRPLHYLGEISYSIYLGHFLFTAIVWRLLSAQYTGNGNISMWVSLVLATLFVVGFATLTYFGIERPGRKLLRDRRAAVSLHA